MTALKRYDRLESTGLWFPAETDDPQGQSVGLTFGDASLVLTDQNGLPLAHWSLPAIKRIEGPDGFARYTADPAADEVLDVEDLVFIEALDTIGRRVASPRKQRGRLRLAVSLGVLAVLLALGTLWLPGALIRQTASNMPPGPRAEIGAALLGHIQSISGATCRSPEGVAALSQLHTRVFGASAPGQTVIVPSNVAAPVLLPGSVIVLPHALLTQTNDPATVAGHMIGAASSVVENDPLARALEFGGFSASLEVLTTGRLPDDILQDYARHVVATPAVLASDQVLAQDFERARVALAPWANVLDPSGESIADLLAQDWSSGMQPEPLLSDSDWVAVQNICQ